MYGLVVFERREDATQWVQMDPPLIPVEGEEPVDLGEGLGSMTNYRVDDAVLSVITLSAFDDEQVDAMREAIGTLAANFVDTHTLIALIVSEEKLRLLGGIVHQLGFSIVQHTLPARPQPVSIDIPNAPLRRRRRGVIRHLEFADEEEAAGFAHVVGSVLDALMRAPSTGQKRERPQEPPLLEHCWKRLTNDESKRKKTDDTDMQCGACMEYEKTVTFEPCGCQFYCDGCMFKQKDISGEATAITCPLCRSESSWFSRPRV
jgi:hypothetical protein